MLNVMKRSITVLVIALISGALALSGCSSSQSSAEGSAEEKIDLGTAVEYFESLATKDPVKMEAAVELAAAGSPAQASAITSLAGERTYQQDQAEASGQPGEVSVEGGTISVCDLEWDFCREYTDIKVEDGQIADFSVDGRQIKDRVLAGGSEAVPLEGLGDAAFLGAAVSVAGGLIVYFEVTSSVEGMKVVATYVAPDGTEEASSEYDNNEGPAIEETRYCSFLFEQVDVIDGNVLLTVSATDAAPEVTVEFPLEMK